MDARSSAGAIRLAWTAQAIELKRSRWTLTSVAHACCVNRPLRA